MEMIGLTLHRTDPGVQKEEPVVDLIAFPRALRIADEMLGVVLLDEILHDTARFEEPDGLPVREGVRQGGYPAIRVDGEEPFWVSFRMSIAWVL